MLVKGVEVEPVLHAQSLSFGVWVFDLKVALPQMAAGGHGVAKNHSLAHKHYLDAHDAGHWRAPHALAIAHQRGLGVRPNCTAAKEYIQTFIKERSSWSDQMDEALLAVDAGVFAFLLCTSVIHLPG